MRNPDRKMVSKLLKMSESDSIALDRVTLEVQNEYRQHSPNSLASELPSSNHILRALIRFADAEISVKSQLRAALVGFCSERGDLWG